MRKVLFIALIAGLTSLISCGPSADEKAAEIYDELTKAGMEVLYDDRDMRAGEKFAEADLLGIPYRIVIGKRSLESGMAEVKGRLEKEAKEVAFNQIASVICEHYARD